MVEEKQSWLQKLRPTTPWQWLAYFIVLVEIPSLLENGKTWLEWARDFLVSAVYHQTAPFLLLAAIAFLAWTKFGLANVCAEMHKTMMQNWSELGIWSKRLVWIVFLIPVGMMSFALLSIWYIAVLETLSESVQILIDGIND